MLTSTIANQQKLLAPPSPSAPDIAPRTRMLLEAPVFPTLLRLSAPNVLNLLALVGLITFDALFVGRLGPQALAGLTLAFPWVMLMQHTAASGMGGAVSSAVARALGAGRRELAGELAGHAVALTIVLSLIFSALMLLSGPALYRWMGGREEVLVAAVAYSNVVFGGAISICALNLLGSIVRGTGNMSLPAMVIVGSVIGHVLLSPLLIFGWGPVPAMGPAGAGWGLVTSFGAGSLFLVGYLRSSRSLVRLTLRGIKLRWSLFAEILKVGVPGTINVCITNLSVVALTGIAGRLGTETAIGYGMGARLEYILIPIAFGFGTSIVAMVGTNWGAKQSDRAIRIAWIGGATVALTCGAIGLFFAIFPWLWMGLFTDRPEIASAGALYLSIAGPVYALYGLGMALYFATQGLGRVVWTVAANGVRLLASAGGGLLAVFWLDTGPAGFFAAIALGFVLYGIFNSLALRRQQPMTRPASHATLSTVVRAATAFLALAACLPEPAEAQAAVQVDANRAQRWLLERDVVTVYRADSGGILRRLILPDGVIAYSPYAPCPPAMILDKSGAAIISSNVLPILWRVDPETFQVQRYELKLDHDGDQDVAFSALVSAPEQGVLYAVSATLDSLWRIDLGSAKAQRIALLVQHRCSVQPLR